MAFQVNDVRAAGTGEGMERRADEIFCRNCGVTMSREAAICVACGVATRRASYGAGAGVGTGEGKSKATSILLAVLFGYFSWLYTYREDSAKFWTALAVSAVNFVLSIFTLGIWLFVAIPVGIGFWIWSIVDAASKQDAWYGNY